MLNLLQNHGQRLLVSAVCLAFLAAIYLFEVPVNASHEPVIILAVVQVIGELQRKARGKPKASPDA